MAFAKGSYVFIPDEEEIFLAAKVETEFSPGKAGVVKPVGGSRTVKLSAGETKEVVAMNAQSLKPIEDMVTLKQLDEASILHNLKMRFNEDEIYTNIGSILVSVNPFKLLPIYTPEIVDRYAQQGSRNLPPHIYGVADNAFRSMVSFGKSQSCIVSGESGAGKTEATKLFLQFISEKSNSKADGANSSTTLSEQILEANPLLEAFGNAKTVRNDNSSRFGKLIEVAFDSTTGSIRSGSITSYLLEKSRLVQHAEKERNYHVFYQLCAAAVQDPELGEFDLMEADQYYFLNQSKKKSSTVVDGMDDYTEWNNTVRAMEVMGVSSDERLAIMRVLAGILHLGNIKFSGSEEKSSVETTQMLKRAADQLGASPEALEKALCMRNRGNAKESVYSNQGVTQAGESRDALAKAVYSKLFDWLIDAKINRTLSGSGAGGKGAGMATIGVLDIFGFESFEHNSFEQLCINYCNEKLQGHFNEHIFKLEQEEYKREGIDVSQITYVDNSKVLGALETKRSGVFSILDEENKLPRGSDEGFLSKVLAKADGEVLLKPDVKDKKKRNHFTVHHYAGPVAYDAKDFLEKNKDLLLTDLQGVGENSSFKFLRDLFKSGGGGAKGKVSPSSKKTIGAQFKDQLAALMQTLNSTEPHYVRCVKSNPDKKANWFEGKMCLDQLRYAGLLEVCRIRKAGYPVRKSFEEFVARYACLAEGAKKGIKHADLCGKLEKKGLLKKGDWQAGSKKLFMRQEQFDDLESARDAVLSTLVVRAQALARGFIFRRRYKGFKAFFKSLDSAVKGRKRDAIEKALLGAGKLPHQGRHLSQVQAARKLLEQLKDEERVADMLEGAMKAADVSALQSALKAAKQIGMDGSAVVKKAKKALTTIEKQRKVAKDLAAAVQSRSLKALEAAIKEADKLEMTENPNYKDAAALCKLIKQETQTVAEMEKAVKKKDIAKIKALLPRMAELGLENHKVTKEAAKAAQAEAKRSKAAEAKMRQIAAKLETAIAEKDLPMLESLTRQAIELGMKSDALDEASRLRQELQGKASIIANLAAEIKAIEIRSKSYEGVTSDDVASLTAAIAAAKSDGVGANDEEMQEAVAVEDRMQKQIKLQKAVKKALEDGSDKALQAQVRKIQELGLETGDAKKLLDEVSARQASKTQAERLEAMKKRNAKIGKLVEATAEELAAETQARERLALSKTHEQRLSEASNGEVYDFRKFFGIRTDEDYCEFAAENLKSDYADYKLRFQSKGILKSLLKLDEDLSKLAQQNFKAVLQYTGEISNQFPTAMAANVVTRGLEVPELADEIYLQLIKQLQNNKREFSVDRTWGLMSMCCRAFPPSGQFEPFLLNFLLSREADPGLNGNYARLCVALLDATIEIGPSKFAPNMESLEAYNARPAVLVEITLRDGKLASMPVLPHQDVGTILDSLNTLTGISKKEENMYAVYVIDGAMRQNQDLHTRLSRFYRKYNPSKLQFVDYFVSQWQGNEAKLFATLAKKYGPEPSPDEDVERSRGKRGSRHFLRLPVTAAKNAAKILGIVDQSVAPPSPESPWPLPWWASFGDVYARMAKQGREPVFTQKRMITFPDDKFCDEAFRRVREDVRNGDLAFPNFDDLAKLTALDLHIQHKCKKFKKPAGKSLTDACVEIMPSSVVKKYELHEIEEKVSAILDTGLPSNVSKAEQEYYELAQNSPTFGMVLFYAMQYGDNKPRVIGIDTNGIHILDESRTKVEVTFDFSKIVKFGATGSFFWLMYAFSKGNSQKVHFKTVTPWSIYSCVYDTTHAVAERR